MTTALILAAGKLSSDRDRGPIDAIGGVSSIRRIISVFRQAELNKIVVVSGDNAGVLERHCAHMGAIFLRNDTYSTSDMLSSAKIGLRYLKGKCRRTFIAPVHFPFFSAETVTAMKNLTDPVVIPMFDNKNGHPLLLAENLFDGVLAYEKPGGLEGYLSGQCERRLFGVNDAGIITDTRNLSDPSELLANHSLRAIRPEAKVSLSCEMDFFDPEVLHLLRLTEESGSLKHAAGKMGISYSKAWKMIANVETQLGFVVLSSRQGGRQGGGSEITEDALDFIRRYETFAAACDDSVKVLFDRHFPSLPVNFK